MLHFSRIHDKVKMRPGFIVKDRSKQD